MSSKVDMPTSATNLNETLLFLWYVIRCHSKKGYQKDMCFKNELHVQNMLVILNSIVNIIDGTCIAV